MATDADLRQSGGGPSLDACHGAAKRRWASFRARWLSRWCADDGAAEAGASVGSRAGRGASRRQRGRRAIGGEVLREPTCLLPREERSRNRDARRDLGMGVGQRAQRAMVGRVAGAVVVQARQRGPAHEQEQRGAGQHQPSPAARPGSGCRRSQHGIERSTRCPRAQGDWLPGHPPTREFPVNPPGSEHTSETGTAGLAERSAGRLRSQSLGRPIESRSRTLRGPCGWVCTSGTPSAGSPLSRET